MGVLRIVFVLAAVIAGGSPGAHALSLDALLAGATITVGDKLFSDWKLIEDGLGADASRIEVSALLDPSNPGLRFVSGEQFETDDGDTGNFAFSYDVTVLRPELRIIGASLEVTDLEYGPGAGFVEVQGAIFPPSLILAASTTFGLSSSELFAPDFPAQTFLDEVETLIYLGAAPGSATSLRAFEMRFSQAVIPEPSGMLLLGTGLLGLALAAGRRCS